MMIMIYKVLGQESYCTDLRKHFREFPSCSLDVHWDYKVAHSKGKTVVHFNILMLKS